MATKPLGGAALITRLELEIGEVVCYQVCSLRWDGRDDSGRALSTGVYLYRLRAEDRVATRKLMLLR